MQRLISHVQSTRVIPLRAPRRELRGLDVRKTTRGSPELCYIRIRPQCWLRRLTRSCAVAFFRLRITSISGRNSDHGGDHDHSRRWSVSAFHFPADLKRVVKSGSNQKIASFHKKTTRTEFNSVCLRRDIHIQRVPQTRKHKRVERRDVYVTASVEYPRQKDNSR